jgi:tRNA U34 5-carboxymethylaminomethyl modifying GTPase MnmE/TrmE
MWILTIAKHFFTLQWLRGIAKESEHVPATIATVFFALMLLVSLSITGVIRYNKAEAAQDEKIEVLEQVLASNQEALAKNTVALYCSSRDRQISAKLREVQRVKLLIEKTDQDYEIRALEEELQELERDLGKLEKGYDENCLNGGI